MTDQAPSALVAISAAVKVIVSSFVITTEPVGSLIVALDGLDKVKTTDSSFSTNVSSAIVTVNVLLISPALKVNVPLVAV